VRALNTSPRCRLRLSFIKYRSVSQVCALTQYARLPRETLCNNVVDLASSPIPFLLGFGLAFRAQRSLDDFPLEMTRGPPTSFPRGAMRLAALCFASHAALSVVALSHGVAPTSDKRVPENDADGDEVFERVALPLHNIHDVRTLACSTEC